MQPLPVEIKHNLDKMIIIAMTTNSRDIKEQLGRQFLAKMLEYSNKYETQQYITQFREVFRYGRMPDIDD